MELLKDYNILILYSLINTNVIMDALSQKMESMGSLAYLDIFRCPLARESQTLANNFIILQETKIRVLLANVERRSTFLDQIKARQFKDVSLVIFTIRCSEVRPQRPFLTMKVFCES